MKFLVCAIWYSLGICSTTNVPYAIHVFALSSPTACSCSDKSYYSWRSYVLFYFLDQTHTSSFSSRILREKYPLYTSLFLWYILCKLNIVFTQSNVTIHVPLVSYPTKRSKPSFDVILVLLIRHQSIGLLMDISEHMSHLIFNAPLKQFGWAPNISQNVFRFPVCKTIFHADSSIAYIVWRAECFEDIDYYFRFRGQESQLCLRDTVYVPIKLICYDAYGKYWHVRCRTGNNEMVGGHSLLN